MVCVSELTFTISIHHFLLLLKHQYSLEIVWERILKCTLHTLNFSFSFYYIFLYASIYNIFIFAFTGSVVEQVNATDLDTGVNAEIR